MAGAAAQLAKQVNFNMRAKLNIIWGTLDVGHNSSFSTGRHSKALLQTLLHLHKERCRS